MEDTPAEGQAVCSACGAPLRPGARFCGVCGAATEQRCSRCGTLLRPGASFCGSCGSRAGGPAPATPRSVRRRPIPPAAAIAGAAAAVAAAVFAGWFFFLRGDGAGDRTDDGSGEPQESSVTVVSPVETGATDPATGLPLRPAVRLAHPDGAAAEIPGGLALYGEAMDLRRIQLSDDPWWDHGGSGWEFVSFTGVPIGGATVDIPAAGGGTVIAMGASGLWFELPAEAIAMADGNPGFRVRVDGVPAPWTLAVATPKAGAPGVSDQVRQALDRERLYWTDRQAWERETATGLEGGLGARPVDARAQVSLHPTQDPNAEYERIRLAVLDSYQLFAAARVGITSDVTVAGGLSPVPGVQISAVGIWGEAANRLVDARDDWLAFRATLGDVTKLPPGQAVAVGFMDQWIETAMHLYTPWGLDFVAVLLEQGELDGFDLRVLKPYGELKWTDIQLAAGDIPGVDAAIQQALAAPPEARIAGAAGIERTLRLYSVRALERLAAIDWLKENIDWIVRWLPVALAAVGLIPGAVGLSFLFASLDQVMNWAQDWYASDPHAFLTFETLSATGVGGTSFVMDMYEESVLMATEGRPMLPAHGLTIAQFAYSVGMFAAVRGTDWYLFNSVRAVNEGTRGYCHTGRCSSLSGMVPPVMVHARVSGNLEQEQDAYPSVAERLMAFRLELGSADYHADWLRGRKGPAAPLADLPFNDFLPAQWPVTITRTEPDYQVIRLTIPKSAIAPEVWGDRPKDAPISAFAPVVTLTGPGGEFTMIDIVQESARRTGESPDNFYATVVLMRDERDIPLAPGLATFKEPFDAPRDQWADFAGPILRTRLQGTLQFADDRTKPLNFEVDFTKSGGPAAAINAVPPRSHVREVALTNDIYGFYDLTSWSVVGGTPDWIANYAELRRAYAPCAATPSACYLRVLLSDGERSVAELFGQTTDGLYFRRFADSQPYLEGWGKDGDLLAPQAHDNFFKLDGPILTGSSYWNVAGFGPGTSAEVVAWNTIRAEFKDGRVSGVISEFQRQEGFEVMTISFAFEGTLRK